MTALRRFALLVLFVFVLALVILTFRHTVWPWIEVHTGTVNESGPYYGFWSGFGSDLGEATLIGVILAPVVVAYRHHKCVDCHWIAHHKTEDTAQRFCHRHWRRDHIDAARERHRLRHPFHLAHEEAA